MPRSIAGNAASAVLVLMSARAEAEVPVAVDSKQQCIAASEQGQSERDEGHYRAARKAFFECARVACPRVVVESCTKWLRDLDDSAPSIVLGATDERGNDLTDVNVTLDGVPLASVLDGKPIEVDAGEHLVRFERAGSQVAQLKLVLRAGEKARVVTAVLQPSGAGGESAVIERGSAVAGEAVRPEPLLSPRHVTATSLGIATLATATIGVYFITRADQDRGTAANLRSGLPVNACTHAVSAFCQTLGDTVGAQHREANAANWFFVGAGALAAGAVISWFSWPAPVSTTLPQAAWASPIPGGAVAGVSGSFR